MKKLKNKTRYLRKVNTSYFVYRIKSLIHERVNPLILFSSVGLLFLTFVILSLNRLPINTHLGDINLGFVNFVDARHLILGKIDDFSRTPIEFDLEGKKYFFTPEDLGISINMEASSNLDAFKYGLRNVDKLNVLSPLVRKSIMHIFTIDFELVASKIVEIKSKEDRVARDAAIIFRDGEYQIQSEDQGTLINEVSAFATIQDRIENLSSAPIVLEKYISEPKVVSAGANTALEKIKKLSNQKVSLSYRGDVWEIGNEELLNLVMFKPDGYRGEYLASISLSAQPIYITDIDFGDKVNRTLEIGLDNQKVDSFVENVALSIDRSRADATLKFENGKVYEFKPAVDGQFLDRAKTRSLLLASVSVNNTDEKSVITFPLPVVIDHARIANDEINSMGIRELIASGVSYFAGSIPNRVFNVGLGASRLSGALVKPGDVFSFNTTVGEVSGATGYKKAYVISEGRTVLDDGGGICQVSTTVFRAALLAGLPIVARTAHAYRVGYYEQGGFKAGMDATVWAPSVDLKFKNDTGHYLLIQAIVDSSRAKLQVDIYGTRDTRKVELGEPKVSNIVPAPPDKYQDDPLLPNGTTKQVDFSAAGATSIFTRKVYKDNELLIDESFKSVFKPWQAVFLVGRG